MHAQRGLHLTLAYNQLTVPRSEWLDFLSWISERVAHDTRLT